MFLKKFDVLWAWFVRITTNWLPDAPCCQRFRGFLYSLMAFKHGKKIRISSDVRFTRLRYVSFGSNIEIGPNVVFLLSAPVTIEDEVLIGHKALVTTTNHTSVDGSFRRGTGKSAPITLKRGSWVGAHSVVLPGVTLGRGSVLGACSVANRSLPDYAVCAGQPAVVKKRLEVPEGETVNEYETIKSMPNK